MIPDETVRRILEATDIVELVGATVILKKSGANHGGLCPFHNEKTPSFNVNSERQTYHCFGCHASGDAIGWIRQKDGLSFVEACGVLAARAGIYLPDQREVQERPVQRTQKRKRTFWRDLPKVPDLDPGTPKDHMMLATLRGLQTETIRTAVARGFVGFCQWGGKPSWVVTDKTRVNAQIRHLSGEPLFVKDDGRPIKAQSVTGAWSKWPLGAAEITTPNVILTEGGPDFLAALELILRCQIKASPVGILGASMPIHEKALPFFRHRRVFAAQHTGQAGADATERWAKQLAGIAEVVPVPMPDDDLNQSIMDYGVDETAEFFPFR